MKLQLIANMKRGQEALRYARSIIRQSNTHPSTPEADVPVLREKIGQMRFSTLNAHSSLNSILRVPTLLRDEELYSFKRVVKLTENALLGNCQEYTFLALNYLRKKKTMNAEMFSIENGDHVFVVIGRALGSDPKLPETWGPDAIICDAWANQVYSVTDDYDPLKRTFKRLKCYKVENDKNVIYDFNPFSPDWHGLKLETGISLGKTNAEDKKRIMNDALDHLRMIRYAIQKTQRSVPTDLPLKHAVTRIVGELNKDIHEILQASRRRMNDSLPNMLLERELSKRIRECVKHIEMSLGTLHKTKASRQFKNTLINRWAEMQECDNTPEVRNACFKALLYLDNSVTIPLIDKMNKETLNTIVGDRRFNAVGEKISLLHVLTIRKNKRYFRELLTRLTPEAVEKIIHIRFDGQGLSGLVFKKLGAVSLINLLNKLSLPSKVDLLTILFAKASAEEVQSLVRVMNAQPENENFWTRFINEAIKSRDLLVIRKFLKAGLKLDQQQEEKIRELLGHHIAAVEVDWLRDKFLSELNEPRTSPYHLRTSSLQKELIGLLEKNVSDSAEAAFMRAVNKMHDVLNLAIDDYQVYKNVTQGKKHWFSVDPPQKILYCRVLYFILKKIEDKRLIPLEMMHSLPAEASWGFSSFSASRKKLNHD